MDKDFNINSPEELKTDLARVDKVAKRIEESLNNLKNTYSNQQEGYASSNSEQQADAMNDLSEKAKTIAENVSVIQSKVGKYTTTIEETDRG